MDNDAPAEAAVPAIDTAAFLAKREVEIVAALEPIYEQTETLHKELREVRRAMKRLKVKSILPLKA